MAKGWTKRTDEERAEERAEAAAWDATLADGDE